MNPQRAYLLSRGLALTLTLVGAVLAHAADRDAFVALDAGSAEVTLIDLGTHRATVVDLERAYARVVSRVPPAVGLRARPEDAAIGRISALAYANVETGPPQPLYQDAHGVVLRDLGCSFVFATVAHFYFDLELGRARAPTASLELEVAGRRFAGAGIRSVRPNEAPALTDNRTLRDIALLLVDKGTDCSPLAELPLFTSAERATGSVWSMCPVNAPQRCGVVIVASEVSGNAGLPTDAMAYHSCSARRGDSGCPLVVLAPDGSRRLLGLQTHGEPLGVDVDYHPMSNLRSASRAALFGDRIGVWLHALQEDARRAATRAAADSHHRDGY